MSRSFDRWPERLPALHLPGRVPAGSYLLTRPADATGLQAAWALIGLHEQSKRYAPGRICLPAAALRTSAQEGAGWHRGPGDISDVRVIPNIAHPETAMLLFEDHSVLVGKFSGKAPQNLILYPVVLRFSPVFLEGMGIKRRVVPAPPFWDIQLSGEHAHHVEMQLCEEINAWASLLDDAPPISLPGHWPAVLPRLQPKSERLSAFEADIQAILHGVFEAAHNVLPQEVHASVYGAQPLQGGFNSIAIHLSWSHRSSKPWSALTEGILRHLRFRLFHGDLGWREDDFPGLMIHEDVTADPSGLSRTILSMTITRAPTHHARLAAICAHPVSEELRSLICAMSVVEASS